jgi:hypothetical protein
MGAATRRPSDLWSLYRASAKEELFDCWTSGTMRRIHGMRMVTRYDNTEIGESVNGTEENGLHCLRY